MGVDGIELGVDSGRGGRDEVMEGSGGDTKAGGDIEASLG